jgi:hypothetical protein
MTRTTNARIAGVRYFVDLAAGISALAVAGRPQATDVLALLTSLPVLVFELTLAAWLFALTLSILAFKSGFELLNSGRPEMAPIFIFGVVALLGMVGDVRLMRAGGIQGSRRITRHLWRMCFAMWVAAASFFWGPPGRVPEVIRIPALLRIPVLMPIVFMLYWLWRIRVRKTVLAIVGASAPPATAIEAGASQ